MDQTCKNCGIELKGPYCSECGQRAIDLQKRTFLNLLKEFFHAITDVDRKFLRSIGTLFLKPGLITRRSIEGITVRYTRLSTLFAIVLATYFLVPPSLFFFLYTPYDTIMREGRGKEYKKEIVAKMINETGVDEKTIALNFDNRGRDVGKILALVLVPLTILILWVINIGIKIFRRNHHYTTYDLGTGTLEILIFTIGFLASLCILDLAVAFLGQTRKGVFGTVTSMLIVLIAIYMHFKFFQNAYELKWWSATLCFVFYVFSYNYISDYYRLLYFSVLMDLQ